MKNNKDSPMGQVTTKIYLKKNKSVFIQLIPKKNYWLKGGLPTFLRNDDSRKQEF